MAAASDQTCLWVVDPVARRLLHELDLEIGTSLGTLAGDP